MTNDDQIIEVDLSEADIVHTRVGDGCIVSVNGEGTLACTEHDYTTNPTYDTLVKEQGFEPRDVQKYDLMGAQIRHRQWLNDMRDRVEAKMAKKRGKKR